jgi:hypothetical protein
MKYFVASDIHGDSYWAQRIADAFIESKSDKLVLLGDILYHGPRNDLPAHYEPKKVIEILNKYADRIIAVRGNCDAEVDQMVLNFPLTADYIYLFSGALTFFVTHGHIYNPMNLPKALPGDAILLTGHTHVAGDIIWEYEDGRKIRYMNPGSPSIPKEDTKPSYIIIENGRAELKTFD